MTKSLIPGSEKDTKNGIAETRNLKKSQKSGIPNPGNQNSREKQKLIFPQILKFSLPG